ncbi:MAG: hypothetical protein J6T27_01250 [Alphaproteobacteria bacterium]|nr:hypothetical protein [Alphaproteobacteria bacterium]
MIQDFLNSINQINLAELSLAELVRIDEMLSYYENMADLSIQREKINQEYLRRSRDDDKMRFKIHEIRTGYKECNWGKNDRNLPPKERAQMNKRQVNGWNPNFGWKFHLDVVPNRDHPVTREISDFLLDLGVAHKIASGGENGKGMTVYVGGYDDICKLAHIIQERFGSKISKPPFYTDQVAQEYAFEPKIYGRFCVGNYAIYPTYASGISPFADDNDEYVIDTVQSKAQNLGITKNEHNNCFFDSLELLYNDNPNHDEIVLTTYCSHKLYVATFGQYYCGTYLKPFEDKFFGNDIPVLGTRKRAKWDEIADTFVKTATERGWIERLRENARGYIPLDLSNLNNEKNTNYQYTHDNGRQ